MLKYNPSNLNKISANLSMHFFSRSIAREIQLSARKKSNLERESFGKVEFWPKNIFHLRFTVYNFRFTVFKQAGKFWKVSIINLRWQEVLEEYFLMTETFWKGHSPEKERPPFGWLWIPQGVHCWIESVIWVESKKAVKWNYAFQNMTKICWVGVMKLFI